MQSNGISKRDQLILFLLGIFLIVVVIGYWGVRPQFRKMASIQNEMEEEEETKRENTMKISQLPMLEAECEEYQKVIDEYQDDFYSVMTSDEIDRMLTSQALSLGLSAYDLEITMPDAPSDRLAYQYSYLYSQQIAAQATAEDQEALGAEERESAAEAEEYATGEESDLNEDGESTTSTYVANQEIYAATVSMTVGGDMEDLQKFLDQLNAPEKRILVVSYAWGEREVPITSTGAASSSADTSVMLGSDESADTSTGEVAVQVTKTLTVNLEIYMNKSDASLSSATDASGNTESTDAVDSGDMQVTPGDN